MPPAAILGAADSLFTFSVGYEFHNDGLSLRQRFVDVERINAEAMVSLVSYLLAVFAALCSVDALEKNTRL
jgi:hypothetical protein